MMKTNFVKTVIFSILCASLLLTASCSKVTKENYDKLRVGQDYDEVVQILGKADECGGAMGIKDCRWGDANKHISVKFAGNKVVIFSAQGL
jgi:hypothetical protein